MANKDKVPLSYRIKKPTNTKMVPTIKRSYFSMKYERGFIEVSLKLMKQSIPVAKAKTNVITKNSAPDKVVKSGI